MAKSRKRHVITEEKLKLWIDLNLNVIIEGKHGTGKTSMIIDAWNKAGIKWAYFSGSTLDPWVDFVGIPEKVTDEKTKQSYIAIVPPQWVLEDVEAIFIDEYNRSAKKLRNAVMEVIQFKTINGRKLGNVRFVWAAINPPDDETVKYDVEEIDPAQLDRFQIHVEVPYEPNRKYFNKKYGKDLSSSVINWWHSQTEKVREGISPRRLECGLDYFQMNGDLKDVFPEGANISHFKQNITKDPKINELKRILRSKDTQQAIDFLKDENNYSQTVNHILARRTFYTFFIPCMPEEKISLLLNNSKSTDTNMVNWAVRNYEQIFVLKRVLDEIAMAGTNAWITGKIKRKIRNSNFDILNDIIGKAITNSNAKVYYAKKTGDILTVCSSIKKIDLSNTNLRKKEYRRLMSSIPETMNTEESLQVLDVLEKIALKTNQKILHRDFDNLIRIINHCFDKCKDSKDTVKVFKQFSKKYPNLSKYIAGRQDFYYQMQDV